MTAAVRAPSAEVTTPDRTPLRLWLGSAGVGRDGVWWPQSRDLATEAADLVDHFPVKRGRISRAVYSSPDWDADVRRAPVRRGYVKLGTFPRDDTHEMRLMLSDRTLLVLQVVPSSATTAQAEVAVRDHGAGESLRRAGGMMSAPDERAGSDRWSDDGGA